VAWLLVGFVGGACSRGEAEPPTVVRDYATLDDALRAAGAATQPGDEISQPFFSVTGRILRVNGEDVQVFVYRDEATATAEAGLVSRDGRTIGNTQVSWIGTPHFHRTGRVIVLYVGQNDSVTGVLTTVLGPQFAGG
jgi:hypothetical protein